MNVLIVGDWHSKLHEEAAYQALTKLGHITTRFEWCHYFKPKGRWKIISLLFLKAQNKYMLGPLVSQLNYELLTKIKQQQPDLIFIYRGTHVYSKTLIAIKNIVPDSILVGYNNDDPFSPHYPRWKWRHFLRGIPEYDLVLAYRLHNLQEFKQAGAKKVDLLRSWFIPEMNHPVNLSKDERQKYECDVVFVGHYEDDGRLEYLEEIARSGVQLKIFGHREQWDRVLNRSKILKGYSPVSLVWGRDYNLALCGAKVALCFFSKLNRDTYTRRCFEIPASGTVLLSTYSSDLAELFKPDKEAVYFDNVKVLASKLNQLFSGDLSIKNISNAGLNRVHQDKHDVESRMKNVISLVDDIRRDRIK